MAQDFSSPFYHSQSWRKTRDAYFRFRNGLCERCQAAGRLTPGAIVHHKEHLTPQNIDDPTVSLSFDNLELLCRECHAIVHSGDYGRGRPSSPMRVAFDEDGNTIELEENEH